MMKWTNEKPTKEGWYWYRDRQTEYEYGPWEIVELDFDFESNLCFLESGEFITSNSGHFVGPLQEPEE